jgi:hypothetical protein
MSTLTKEWLLKTIAELEEERDATPGGVNEDAAMALAAMKRALASLMAEPDFYVVVTSVGVWQSFCKTKAEAEFIVSKPFNPGYSILEINTAPPAPVSVPDEDLLHMAASAIDDLISNKDRSGAGVWADIPSKLRRAAMLQGADGNSPVIPDSWVLVPVEPTEDMIVNGFESEPDESFSDEDEWEAYDAMSGCQQAAHRAKLCYAAMIAAAPKPKP